MFVFYFCFIFLPLYSYYPVFKTHRNILWATESKKHGFLSRPYTPTILDLAHIQV